MNNINYEPLPVVAEIVEIHPANNELLNQLNYESADDPAAIVSSEETERRLRICTSCDRFGSDDQRPGICLECNGSIPMITTLNFKTCPISKWSNK